MKGRSLLMMFVVALFLVACDNNENIPTTVDISGDYKGYSDADCGFFQNRYTDDECMKISANEDGTVAVVFETSSWGTFNVVSATVVENSNGYVISGSGSVAMGMGTNVSNYDFTINGTLNAEKSDYNIVFNVPAVMKGLTITFLPGTAPAVGA